MEAAFMDSGTTVDKVNSISIVKIITKHRTSSHRYLQSISFDQKKGENARLSSFIGAISIADLVKTTLGPKGMDKILQRIGEHDQSISVTNDGATILKSVNLDNAAAKVLVDIARVQDDEVGDGTTSVAVLCGELL
jgi:chaperonin GroEL (HSP60 family)